MSSNERQKRYIQRLKVGAAANANNETASATNASGDKMDSQPDIRAATNDIDFAAIVAWWKRAKASERTQLCEAMGARKIADALYDDDEFNDYLDEVVRGTLEDYAESWGYKKIEARK